MSKKRLQSKENNWIDKSYAPYKQGETIISNRIDRLKHCIESDCILHFLEDGGIEELGKNKQITRIQKLRRPPVLNKKNVKVTKTINKQQGK